MTKEWTALQGAFLPRASGFCEGGLFGSEAENGAKVPLHLEEGVLQRCGEDKQRL